MKTSQALLAMVALTLALMSVCSAQGYECGLNEHADDCGTACERTCLPRRVGCTMNCVQGCFCLPGYVREVEGGRCIPLEDCAPDNTMVALVLTLMSVCSEPLECGPNEYLDSCGTPCQLYCNADPVDLFCPLVCASGCFCQPGLIREVKDGKCIPLEEQKHSICPYVCASGCVCKPGFIREVKNGQCIPQYMCRDFNIYTVLLIVSAVSAALAPQQCGPNEAYEECGPAVPLTCESRFETCTVDCVPGCFCHDGYIRETAGGACIPSNECPKKIV
uniref:TIL domain-containing protein n=1 Tax=Anopheles dirus TaxID=7168 RepID=A0A182NIS6_9DIPT